MKGWVYVISNPSMPGIVKIGYSLKDPMLRAQELDSTGVPHSYVVEYSIMVDNPQQLEQRVHKSLKCINEKKEWFRCSLEKAVTSIRGAVQGKIYLEDCQKVKMEAPSPPPQPIDNRQPLDSRQTIGNRQPWTFDSVFRETGVSTYPQPQPRQRVVYKSVDREPYYRDCPCRSCGQKLTLHLPATATCSKCGNKHKYGMEEPVFSEKPTMYSCYFCRHELGAVPHTKITCPKCGRTYKYP